MKDRSNKGLAQKLKVVMAIVLICVGLYKVAYGIYEICSDIKIVDQYFIAEQVGNCLMIVGGVVLYRLKKQDTKIVVGVAGIIIGVSEIVSSSMSIISSMDFSSPMTIALFALVALIPLMDLFLIIFSIRYMQGNRRNAIRMAIVVGISLVITLLVILALFALMLNSQANLWYLVGMFLPLAVLYGVFFWFLLLPSVREDFSEWKVYDLSVEMYESVKVHPKASVYRDDLVKFMDTMKDTGSWEDSKDIPDCKECSLVFGKDMHLKRLTLRKVDGSDKIRASITTVLSKEYIQTTRFDLMEVVPMNGGLDSCPLIRIFGHDGFFLDLRVRDDNPVPRKTYAIDRLIDRMRFSSETQKK